MDTHAASTGPDDLTGVFVAPAAPLLSVLLLFGSLMVSTVIAADSTANCRDDGCLLDGTPTPLPGQSLIRVGKSSSLPITGIRVVAGDDAADTDGDGIQDSLDVCGSSPTYVPVNRFGCRLVGQRLATVRFELAEAGLTPQSKRRLESVAATLRQYADMRVALAAHTDDSGSEQSNLRLASRRANSVAVHLARLGVSPARLILTPYGERVPVADNAVAMGRAENRRVEITVLADKQSIKGRTGVAQSDAPTDDRLPAAGRIDE